jgi:hypothetical protein
MVLSFEIYRAYPVVGFLPISAWPKMEVAMRRAAVSRGMFFVWSERNGVAA